MTIAHTLDDPTSDDGTQRPEETILLSPPDVGPAERDALMRAFDSGWIAPLGPEVDAFEADLADATGRAHAVALSSGTAAIHLALVEAGVEPGDEVIASTFTFAATVNPIRYCGAHPVLIDSEPRTWGMDPELLEAALNARATAGRPPKAIVAVDLFGQVFDHAAIGEVAARYDVPLVEDAAEALGSLNASGRPAGSVGDAGVISFNGNKMITTSGGGVLVTDDPDVAMRARVRASQSRVPAPHYEHAEVGFNYRLSNLLAAVGRAQLAGLPEKVHRRRAIAHQYRTGLASIPGLAFGPFDAIGTSNGWLTVITIDPETGVTPDALRLRLAAAGIESRPVWKPMHQQPVFRVAHAVLNGTSDRAFATGLCLPSGSTLTPGQVDRVVAVVTETLGRRP